MSLLMSILSWIVVGFIVGLIARAIVPGQQALGFWKTTLLGIIGAFIGGLIYWMFTGAPTGAEGYRPLAWPGWILSTISAVVLLWIVYRQSGKGHIRP